MIESLAEFIKSLYKTNQFIPLHEPRFCGREKEYLNDCIDSTFVSSVGKYVDILEKKIAEYVGSDYAIATSSGTAALHISLILSNVNSGDEVITQPMTFIATCNAIKYVDANPIFIDIDKDTLGMSPSSLESFLKENCYIEDNKCINKATKRVVKACVPMHTFGNPCRILKIKTLCKKWNITLIEDSAESLGSFYFEQHTGTFGDLGIFSFNGNKVITAGGGGIIVTNKKDLALKAKHLTTTAKIPHKWEYIHDSIAYNYRMPNLNAALLVAQFEQLDNFLYAKRQLFSEYKEFCGKNNIKIIEEIEGAKSNYWLNTIITKNKSQRDKLLDGLNSRGVMSRPVWELMPRLEIFKCYQKSSLKNAEEYAKKLINLPSSVRLNDV